MDELELIQRLTKHLPTNASLVVGAGDDCAVLDLGLADRQVLFKTDAVVEGRLQAAWLRRATRSTRCSCCLGIPIWTTLPRIWR